MNDRLPDWLNALASCAIMGTALYGAWRFFDPAFEYTPSAGIHNFYVFAPATIIGVLYAALRVFTGRDLAATTIMVLSFLAAGAFVSAAFTSDPVVSTKLTQLGSALAGFVVGIPAGESLRKRRDDDDDEE